MRQFNMAVAAALTCASLTVGGCAGAGDALQTVSDVYQEGGEQAVAATSRVLNIECARSLDRRKQFVTDVNALQLERGKTARAVPQDCNGDGQPDF